MFKRLLKRFFLFLVILIVFMFVNNTSLFMKDSDREPFLLAHRGLAQTFPMEGIMSDK